ncbi:uncharacterized protein EDB91DRAFT_714942 [Suillus paluster]|uniref:uncharacterized protein n=1 Tax=Suillus paluster TaxID=48578 RepID=UPI001B8786FB|nr:uncharacterized protein EDB91DRAFT_714942 [Suillus paluster]KAG1731645.1 hypothetical protein EDB91DRAFT_714942 [Suillus paluster]
MKTNTPVLMNSSQARFLREDGSLTSDTMPLGFGWGRRIYVGRRLADTSLWIAISNFLAVFSAQKALDEYGMDISVIPKFSTGIVVRPEKFPCRIVPRIPDAFMKKLTQSTGLGPSVNITSEFWKTNLQYQSNRDRIPMDITDFGYATFVLLIQA